MTAKERKIARLKRLLAELNEDLRAVAQIATKARALLAEVNARTGPVPDRDLMAMAAYLHHFYTGVESMFERISRQIDGGPHKTGDWHRELLKSMAIELEGLRPAVISRELMEELDEYRRFRHLFRHAYAGELRTLLNFLSARPSRPGYRSRCRAGAPARGLSRRRCAPPCGQRTARALGRGRG